MNIQVTDRYEDLSVAAANIVFKGVQSKRDLVLGLPTGRTPLGLYSELVRMYRDGLLDLSGVTTFNLDEYYPMNPQDPRGYRVFMRQHFFDNVNIPAERIHMPDASDPDPEKACARYEMEIARVGGIDLLILGTGRNGHIGFNEPGTAFNTRTRLVELTDQTIRMNFGLKSAGTPRFALSMGVATIMEARDIVLLASGADKSAIVKKALFGPITPEIPASVLQQHPSVTVIVDREAAAGCLHAGLSGSGMVTNA
ncbi:MAG: glucosamine-6-phosphate deaminase [Firmicutes bacterium]|nr:glucosamine-6-phosphate deaminase [Bacillota bacterium]